jgi:hypothetical protein
MDKRTTYLVCLCLGAQACAFVACGGSSSNQAKEEGGTADGGVEGSTSDSTAPDGSSSDSPAGNDSTIPDAVSNQDAGDGSVTDSSGTQDVSVTDSGDGGTSESGSDTGCGTCDSGTGDSSTPPPTTYYVNASTGLDANPGTLAMPWRTITHATAAASGPASINVAPGTYSTNETFPITLQANQQLVGDVASQGLGINPTTISGVSTSTTCVGTTGTVQIPSTSSGASIRGFNIVTASGVATSIVVCGATATIGNNTIGGGGNELGVQAVGGANLTLTSNTITAVTGGVGLFVMGTSTAVKARGNSISGSFYAVQLGNGTSFTGSLIDFGTAASPGNNTFLGTAAGVGVSFSTATTSVVSAVGNTWHPSVQGADTSGHYASTLVDGTAGVAFVAGNNYRITAGAGSGIQF